MMTTAIMNMNDVQKELLVINLKELLMFVLKELLTLMLKELLMLTLEVVDRGPKVQHQVRTPRGPG